MPGVPGQDDGLHGRSFDGIEQVGQRYDGEQRLRPVRLQLVDHLGGVGVERLVTTYPLNVFVDL